MLALVTGAVRSGKSSFAEVLLAQLEGTEKIYLATGIRHDAEMQARIAHHQMRRRHKGFRTLEQPLRIGEAAQRFDQGAAVLLECLGTLLGNILSDRYRTEQGFAGIGEEVGNGLHRLMARAKHLIVVSNDVFSDGVPYEEMSLEFIQLMSGLHREIGRKAQLVVECVYGLPLVYKGAEFLTHINVLEKRGESMRLIVGGRAQGKTEYALSLKPEGRVLDLSDGQSDLAKWDRFDILIHVHEWVRRVLLAGKSPDALLTAHLPQLKGRILTGDEIGSGIVPIDPFERTWRDETGRAYQRLAKHADIVERVHAGIPMVLKQNT